MKNKNRWKSENSKNRNQMLRGTGLGFKCFITYAKTLGMKIVKNCHLKPPILITNEQTFQLQTNFTVSSSKAFKQGKQQIILQISSISVIWKDLQRIGSLKLSKIRLVLMKPEIFQNSVLKRQKLLVMTCGNH